MEGCLAATKTWLNGLHDLYVPCERHRGMMKDLESECSSKQIAFESASCTLYTVHDAQCTTYENCWAFQQQACNNICDNVELSVAARKADNKTAEKVKCLLAVLVADNADKAGALEDCEAIDTQTDGWDITCPETKLDPFPTLPPMPVIDCGPPRLTKPCDQSWLEVVYDMKIWNDAYVIDKGFLGACNACASGSQGLV